METIEFKPQLFICDCTSREHQIIMVVDGDEIYCHIHLAGGGFFKRLVGGARHIFGYHCKYGHFDEFILNKNGAKDMVRFLRTLK